MLFSSTPSEAVASNPDDLHAIEIARAQVELLDAVFRLVLHFRHTPAQTVFAVMREAFPDQSQELLQSKYAASVAMLSDASGRGDELLDAKFSNYESVLQQLRASYPGFSDQSYSLALDYACRIAR